MSDLLGLRGERCEKNQTKLLLKRSNGRNQNPLPIVIVLEYMPHHDAGSVRAVGAQVDDLIGKGRLAAVEPDVARTQAEASEAAAAAPILDLVHFAAKSARHDIPDRLS